MKAITFNKLLFLRTIVIFLILTISWTILCKVTGEFTDRDKGLFSGFGYLVLLPVALFTGQQAKSLTTLSLLIFFTVVLFLVSSFVLGMLIESIGDSMIVYAIANSLFVPIVLTTLLHRTIGIEFRRATIIISFLFLLLAYAILEPVSRWLDHQYDLNPRLTMFNIFQLFLVIPLTLGMTVKSRPIGDPDR